MNPLLFAIRRPFITLMLIVTLLLVVALPIGGVLGL